MLRGEFLDQIKKTVDRAIKLKIARRVVNLVCAVRNSPEFKKYLTKSKNEEHEIWTDKDYEFRVQIDDNQIVMCYHNISCYSTRIEVSVNSGLVFEAIENPCGDDCENYLHRGDVTILCFKEGAWLKLLNQKLFFSKLAKIEKRLLAETVKNKPQAEIKRDEPIDDDEEEILKNFT